MTTSKSSLYRLLIDSFDTEEIKTIIFDLDLDQDEFGYPEKSAIVRKLVTWCYDNGRVPDLIERARFYFPEQPWPDPTIPQSINALLGEDTTPQLAYEPETVAIPTGAFVMGAADGLSSEGPQHVVELHSYRLGRYPVTNEQYGEFVRQTNHAPPKAKGGGWMGRKPRKLLDHPVRGVSWEDARAYCHWLSTQTGRTYRLPTEAEWEKAARGSEGFIYPWGNAWEAERVHHAATHTAAVTSYESGQSPYGCYQMLGNVWEWTQTIWGEALDEPNYVYPYRASDGRERLDTDPTVRRILRGGSFDELPQNLRCTRRDRDLPTSNAPHYGFRVVWEI